MAFKIIEDCVACGYCEPVCKNKAIKEGEDIYYIDPELCTGCVGWFNSPQCIGVCWLHNIVPDTAHKETKAQLLAKWKKMHPGRKPEA
jgi:ferredoxin